MRHDPTAFHRELLAGSRPDQRRPWPVPAAALTALCAAGVLGVLDGRATALAAWVLLGLVAGPGCVLLGLRRRPARPHRAATSSDAADGWISPDGGAGSRRRAGTVLVAAELLDGVLLVAACAALAAALLGLAVTGAAGLVVLAVALQVVLRGLGPARRRLLTAMAWAGLAGIAAVVVAGVVALAADPMVRRLDPDVPAALLATALGGMLLRPALPGRYGGPAAGDHVRTLLAAAGVGAVLAVVAAGAGTPTAAGAVPALDAAPALVAAGVVALLVVVLLAAAATGLSGRAETAVPGVATRRPRPAARPVGVGAGAVLAVLLAGGDVTGLVACLAVTVLLRGLLVLVGARADWRAALDTLDRPAPRRRARRDRALVTVAAVVAALLLVLAATRGWPAVLAVALASGMMWGVDQHDRRLRTGLAAPGAERTLPTHVRAFVVASTLAGPDLRAVACARSMRSTSLELLVVAADERAGTRLRERWQELELGVPLVQLAAPPGRAETAVVEHVAAARRAEPDGMAVVYLPELTSGSGWRRLLLPRGTRRLRRRLLTLPGTVVSTVPWVSEERAWTS